MQRIDIALVKSNDSKMSRSFEKVTELNTQQWHSKISLNCSDVVPMWIWHCKSLISIGLHGIHARDAKAQLLTVSAHLSVYCPHKSSFPKKYQNINRS